VRKGAYRHCPDAMYEPVQAVSRKQS
jgi:hypothetical protein